MNEFLVAASSGLFVATRYLVLAAFTVLILFVALLALSLLWSRPNMGEILIKPFVVVDPSGNLKNAESGFAQILSAQIADLQQGQVLSARALLQQARSGQSLREQVDVPAKGQPTVLRDPPWPEVHATAEPKVDFKVQGVDVSGLLSWIKAQVVPERKGLTFTVHVAGDGYVTIAGDVRDMGIDGENALYLPPAKHSPIEALNNLALRLFQLRLAMDEPDIAHLPLTEFRALIDHLAEAADTRIATRTEVHRREHFAKLSAYFSGFVTEYGDWPAITILAAETARRAGDEDAARKYLQLALQHEDRLGKDSDPTRRNLIEASLVGIISPAAARVRGLETVVSASEPVVRHIISGEANAGIEQLRKGFQALYDTKGEGGYSALAGLVGAPGWFSWNHGQNARSSANMNLFLPWYRAFLINFERAARVKVPDFALVCWDWTKGGVPRSFSERTLPGGARNPLYEVYIDLPQARPPITRLTSRSSGAPDELPSIDDVKRVLSEDTWHDFSTALEKQRDVVQGWSSGDMGVIGTTAFDPLFYALMCNVDRLWAIWQKAHGPLDGSAAIDSSLLDVVLVPFGIKVRDVLDTRKFGYVYED